MPKNLDKLLERLPEIKEELAKIDEVELSVFDEENGFFAITCLREYEVDFLTNARRGLHVFIAALEEAKDCIAQERKRCLRLVKVYKNIRDAQEMIAKNPNAFPSGNYAILQQKADRAFYSIENGNHWEENSGDGASMEDVGGRA